jgi:asparagine synthase (glutamine-hydrolysing)
VEGQGPSPAAHAVVIGDVRLDDRQSLVAAVGLPGRSTDEDIELVRAAYDRYGDRCPDQVVGDYAFALWDERRRRFFCARDPFGVKPFYYHLSPHLFIFGSDPQAVLRASGARRELNPGPLVDYLFGVFEDTTATPYRGVERLPAGHVLIVEEDRHQCRRHWQPETVPELRLPDDAAYEEAFRDALTGAVASRLPAKDAGVYLSGGLDSTAVICVAQRLYAGGRLRGFSAVFDDEPRSDERGYAQAAATHAGSELVRCHPERTSPLSDWVGAPWTWPAPSLDAQVALCQTITEAAMGRGVKVLLTGFGGDSVVSHGPTYLTELARSLRLRRFGAAVRATARRHQRPVWPLVKRYGLAPNVPRAVIRRRRARQAWGSGVPVRPDLAAALGVPERIAALQAQSLSRTARDAHLSDLMSGPSIFVLEGSWHVDTATGVERRHPFLDRRVAELCLSLPGEQKLRDGWTRSIMRRALVGILPDEVRFRVGKTNLSPAFERSLMTTDRPVIEALVEKPTVVADWVEPAGLDALWHRCLTQGEASDCYALWRVAVLAAWLRHHGFAE